MKLKLFLFPVFSAMLISFSVATAQPNGAINSTDAQPPQYRIKNLSINSKNSDFGLFPISADNFFFSSNRENENGGNEKQKYNWNHLPFLDIYTVNKDIDNEFSDPVALPGGTETKFNEGPVFYDTVSSTFFITRNDFNKKKVKQSRNGINKLKIYTENIDGSSFKSFGEFQFNNSQYSVAHAALSKDGQKIYFCSDMPGGLGGVDIYVAEKDGDKWGMPKNLGPAVNTAGNEMFPFVSSDNKLYFSSNGYSATSGLDIFSADINGDEYKNLKNLGSQINSDQDDFSFYIYPDNKTGYFSSNRSGGKGDDDIYFFEPNNPVINGVVLDEKDNPEIHFAKIKIVNDDLKVVELVTDSAGNFKYEGEWGNDYTIVASKEGFVSATKSVNTGTDKTEFKVKFNLVKEEFSIEGLVLNKDNKAGIPDATVSLIHKTTGIINTVNSDENGSYHFNVKPNNEYIIRVEKQKFVTTNIPVSTQGMSVGVKQQNVLLEELLVGKSIKIENVYYDLGKADIRADAKIELDKMVALMNENPTMAVELSAHTDSRGSDASNLSLSDRRAKAVAAYIVLKGIAKTRITGKGYGETRLLNDCKNTKKCSDAEHQINRRTEFKILKI